MASTAHCLYCFEVVTARLEKRSALNLRQVQDLWTRFNGEDATADKHTGVKRPEDTAEQSHKEDQHEAEQTTIQQALRPVQVTKLQDTALDQSSSASNSSKPSSATLSSDGSKVSTGSSLSTRSGTFDINKEEQYPLFVTWNTLNSRGHQSLRGCIGTFEAQPLSKGLREYALTSALHDERFLPISMSEVSSLACDVTLLTNFTPCNDPLDWHIGTHGIRISFTHHNRRYGSTYLPQVAPEQGWTKEETMVSLMRKAGWSGRSSDWRKVADLKCIRYEGSIADLEYSTFREWRDWVDRSGE